MLVSVSTGGYNHGRNSTCGNGDVTKVENSSPSPAHHTSSQSGFINLRDPIYLLKDGKHAIAKSDRNSNPAIDHELNNFLPTVSRNKQFQSSITRVDVNESRTRAGRRWRYRRFELFFASESLYRC